MSSNISAGTPARAVLPCPALTYGRLIVQRPAAMDKAMCDCNMAEADECMDFALMVAQCGLPFKSRCALIRGDAVEPPRP